MHASQLRTGEIKVTQLPTVERRSTVHLSRNRWNASKLCGQSELSIVQCHAAAELGVCELHPGNAGRVQQNPTHLRIQLGTVGLHAVLHRIQRQAVQGYHTNWTVVQLNAAYLQTTVQNVVQLLNVIQRHTTLRLHTILGHSSTWSVIQWHTTRWSVARRHATRLHTARRHTARLHTIQRHTTCL